MTSITDLAAAGSVAAGDYLVVSQSGTDRKADVAKFVMVDVAQAGKLILGPGTTLTISAGSITPTGSYHVIDTEAAAASDDLVTVTAIAGQILFLRTANSARDVTLKHGTGNLFLGGSDVVLNNTADAVMLFCVGTSWVMLGRVDN